MQHLLHKNVEMKHDISLPCLIPFLTCTDHLDLVGILDCFVQYIDHVLSFFVYDIAVSILAVGAGVSLEHAKGAYLVVL